MSVARDEARHALPAPTGQRVTHPDGGRRRAGPLLLASWLALAALASYVYFANLTAVEWKNDEVGYRNAGLAYLRGDFDLNTEHPFLVKYLYGLAQLLVGGGSPLAVRAVSAGAAVLTTAAVVALVHRAAGAAAGVLAGLLWVLLPHPVQLGVRAESVAPKLERIASLEAVMVLLLTSALLLAWRWTERKSMGDAVALGVMLGLAGGAKASAAFAVPAIVLVVGYVMHRDDAVRRMLPQAAAAVAVAVGTLVLTYLPDLASMPQHIGSILDNAASQSAGGHAVIVAGERYDTAPWWSLAYWQWAGQGTAVTAALAVAAALAVLRRRLPGRLVALLGLSIVIPFLWLSLGTGFLLSHYAAIYQPALAALAAMTVVDLLRSGGAARVAGVGLAAALLGFGAATTVGHVAQLEPTGYAVLNDAAEVVPEEGLVAVSGNAFAVSAYFPDALTTGAPRPGITYDAVVVDTRQPLTPEVGQLLRQQQWVLARQGESVRLYVAP